MRPQHSDEARDILQTRVHACTGRQVAECGRRLHQHAHTHTHTHTHQQTHTHTHTHAHTHTKKRVSLGLSSWHLPLPNTTSTFQKTRVLRQWADCPGTTTARERTGRGERGRVCVCLSVWKCVARLTADLYLSAFLPPLPPTSPLVFPSCLCKCGCAAGRTSRARTSMSLTEPHAYPCFTISPKSAASKPHRSWHAPALHRHPAASGIRDVETCTAEGCG